MKTMQTVVVLALFLVATFAIPNIPRSHVIPNVPYYKQAGNWSCGDASLQMVLDYWGEPVPEFAVADVARSDPKEGTLSVDVVRALKYSRMSSSVGNYFVNTTTQYGFPGHPRGLAAFWHDSQTPWIDEAFSIIAQDMPLILLTVFDPFAKKREGHFRVLIGYDYDAQTVTLHDPLGGQGNPPLLVWPFSTFIAAWNYTEGQPTPRVNPFFAAVAYPWTIDITTQHLAKTSIKMQAIVTYPLVAPMTSYPSPAQMILVSVATTQDLRVSRYNKSQVYFPSLAPGEQISVSWFLDCFDESTACLGQNVTVTGEGMVWGSQPIEPIDRHNDYPSYDWLDVIGAQQTVTLGKDLMF